MQNIFCDVPILTVWPTKTLEILYMVESENLIGRYLALEQMSSLKLCGDRGA